MIRIQYSNGGMPMSNDTKKEPRRATCCQWRFFNCYIVALLVSHGIRPTVSFVYQPTGRRRTTFPFQKTYELSHPHQWSQSRSINGNVLCNQNKGPSTTSTTQLLCQLLGMNCATATDFSLSWPDFCKRGGETDIHADGWGLAYYHGAGIRQFHDVEPASTSALARFLGQQPIETSSLMAHIRYATSGQVDLANVHPFSREMWAMNWCFSHNGQIPLFDDHPDFWLGEHEEDRFHYPVGHTDSEKCFCAILNALRAEFTHAMPSLPVLHSSLQKLCQQIVDYDPERTILNFLLTCGPHLLWVYSWPGRRPGSKVWNGLHYTVRSCQSPSLSPCRLEDTDYSVEMSGKNDSIDDSFSSNKVCSIIATTPLNTASNNSEDQNDEWIELERGELILFDNGLPHRTRRDLLRVELQGRGLNNDGKVLAPPPAVTAVDEEDLLRLHEKFEMDWSSAATFAVSNKEPELQHETTEPQTTNR